MNIQLLSGFERPEQIRYEYKTTDDTREEHSMRIVFFFCSRCPIMEAETRTGENGMSLFRKKEMPVMSYDRETQEPALRCSICTGEQVAGFRDRTSGRFEEVALIRTEADLEEFRRRYGIDGEIPKFY